MAPDRAGCVGIRQAFVGIGELDAVAQYTRVLAHERGFRCLATVNRSGGVTSGIRERMRVAVQSGRSFPRGGE
jgi:hypothetical protein